MKSAWGAIRTATAYVVYFVSFVADAGVEWDITAAIDFKPPSFATSGRFRYSRQTHTEEVDMGTVYRKTAHYPLPGGAERFEKAGQTLARWRRTRKKRK